MFALVGLLLILIILGLIVGAVAGVVALRKKTGDQAIGSAGRRIDPFAVGEPWRQFVKAALQDLSLIHI